MRKFVRAIFVCFSVENIAENRYQSYIANKNTKQMFVI